MRRLAVLALAGGIAAAHAQGMPASAKSDAGQLSADPWLPRDTAELQVLDKVNAKATPLALKVGQAADNASLSISLRACVVRPPDRAQDSAAYLDIRDSRPGVSGFHGWIFANEPAVSMFEHPLYDVKLIACR